jgi:hypothetical protein
MAEIQLVKSQPTEISEADKAAARSVLFGVLDGLGEVNRKAWRRFWNRMFKLQPGEIVEVHTHQERLGWFHRKHMALESAVFEAQERFDSFEHFRTWLKVGAGFVDWYPGPKGGVIPVPRSIKYSKLEQGEMEKFQFAAVAFLRTEHAARTLWPKMPAAERAHAIELVLARFEEH